MSRREWGRPTVSPGMRMFSWPCEEKRGERERGYKQLAGRGSVGAEEERKKKGGYGERFTLTKN
jgi:hypothetical protein